MAKRFETSGDKVDYVHGYSSVENSRLMDQARTLTDLLHHDTAYPSDSRVLEAGCGVGAQTVSLAANSPKARITAIDISEKSLSEAKKRVYAVGYRHITFVQADIFRMPFSDESFDHIFVCFVLEHLPNPMEALERLKRKLKKGGTITVIEGDHGSTYFYPESQDAQKTIQCLIDIQARMKGNALIGRRLYPILRQAEFREIRVTPRMVYVDGSMPALIEGFTKKTFIAMVEGARALAIETGLITEKRWRKGIDALNATTGENGTFCYTFFKGTARK